MPDPIRKLLGYGQLWPLRPACGQNRAGSYNYASSDFPHPIQFRFFQRRHGSFIVQHRFRSDLDGLFRVWPSASGLEASRWTGIIGFVLWQNTTGPIPISHFQIVCWLLFQRCPGSYCAKPARIRFGQFWLTVSGFGQTDPVRKQACAHESSGPLLTNRLPSRSGSDANRIQARLLEILCLKMNSRIYL